MSHETDDALDADEALTHSFGRFCEMVDDDDEPTLDEALVEAALLAAGLSFDKDLITPPPMPPKPSDAPDHPPALARSVSFAVVQKKMSLIRKFSRRYEGRISLSELVAIARSQVVHQMEFDDEQQHRLREAFERIDVDCSGSIDMGELENFLLKIGMNVTNPDVNLLFARCRELDEESPDAIVSFTEFKYIVQYPHRPVPRSNQLPKCEPPLIAVELRS
jgi:hypothetical protein